LNNKDIFCSLPDGWHIHISNPSFSGGRALANIGVLFGYGWAMLVDWINFTPLASLGGGGLIGLSAGLMFLGLGRIAGISGILGSLLRNEAGDVAWRALFLLGLLAAPGLWLFLVPQGLPPLPAAPAGPQGWAVIALGGLLVGFGTRLAGGCTSGHGVCGLARLSTRSAVAVLSFMASGGLTVYVARHLLGV
jgi:uncharacterized protein